MVYTVGHYIAGEELQNTSTRLINIHNPATAEIVGKVYCADEAICNQAVLQARESWPLWAETPPIKRAKVLFKFHELLEKNQNDIAKIVTREHGKTLDDARGSIARALEVVESHCGILTQLQGDFTLNAAREIDCYTFRQPLGVCVGISPFNFPIMVPAWMMIPAIACGNAFILKPSEQDPGAALRLVELLNDAGLPKGIANCLQGDKTTVDYLISHEDVMAVTAVASTPVAKNIYTKATACGKRAHTFGGAKNHCLVMPDAVISHTANAIVGAAFGSAGERCMALSVVVAVGDKTADNLLNALMPLVNNIKIDKGDAPDCDMGPLISFEHKKRVIEAINNGVAEGAKLVIDGRQFTHPELPEGYFLGPTIFDNVTENMFIYQQEIFGPVLVIVRVDSFSEGLALINRNQYGNGSAIFTKDGYAARCYSEKVQAGMVGINIPIPVPIANHPFGGWKQSSFGDTNMHGRESIQFYTKRKTVTVKWPHLAEDATEFAMPSHQ